MNNYRYTLEKYKGRQSRYVCPQCGRKYVFTRYIDTETNKYIADNVGKCSRLDKCGYHYTPREYFSDNPHKKEVVLLHCKHRVLQQQQQQQQPTYYLPEIVATGSIGQSSTHMRWLAARFGQEQADMVQRMYRVGGLNDDVIFWQRDVTGRLRTGKIMAYDEVTGCRKKGLGTVDWVHAAMRREGALPEEWELRQCLYGEHLLTLFPLRTVAVVESYKTAHIGAILMPRLVWVAVDSMTGLTAERLKPLAGRNVVLFPDEGRGYEYWSSKIEDIARQVGFRYRISDIMEGRAAGSDIGDLPVGNIDYVTTCG